MTSVTKKHRKESFESLMRRFKKSYERNDTANLVKSREYFLNPSLKRKRAHDIAVKIEQKRQEEQKLKKFGSR